MHTSITSARLLSTIYNARSIVNERRLRCFGTSIGVAVFFTMKNRKKIVDLTVIALGTTAFQEGNSVLLVLAKSGRGLTWRRPAFPRSGVGNRN